MASFSPFVLVVVVVRLSPYESSRMASGSSHHVFAEPKSWSPSIRTLSLSRALRRAQSLILALLLAASLVRYDSALPPLDLRYVSLTTQPRLLLPPLLGVFCCSPRSFEDRDLSILAP